MIMSGRQAFASYHGSLAFWSLGVWDGHLHVTRTSASPTVT